MVRIFHDFMNYTEILQSLSRGQKLYDNSAIASALMISTTLKLANQP